MISVRGYAAPRSGAALEPFSFERREPGEHDVLVDIEYCGVCHSDIHSARGEWNEGVFPMVPGHEIAGRVNRVGARVSRFKPGDAVGVGCFVDSCRACAPCKDGLEQYCAEGPTFTYGDTDKTGRVTYGGYSSQIVLDENYVLRMPPGLPLERAAPLLCAGITTYSPLRRWRVGKGSRVAVLGLGGLGHMAVKLAASLGAEVSVISTSPSKKSEARRLGAHEFFLVQEGLAAPKNHFDFILDTVSAPHDLDRFLSLLRRDGTLILVGAPPEPLKVEPFSLIMKRASVAGSLIGGIRETQEMLDHCGKNGIMADVEVIPLAGVNEAYERVAKGDVRYRFVIDPRKI
ncbi:MAG: NAD(P)-dependent alcohol dehydrogenase [Elusimicrobiota bacterium]